MIHKRLFKTQSCRHHVLPAAWSDPPGCIVRIKRQSNETRFATALRVLAAV